MKRLLIAALMLFSAQTAHATDSIDGYLKIRATMVAAVATLLVLPAKCTVNRKTPDHEEIARFVYAYGYKGDDVFLAEVKAAMKGQEDAFRKLPAADQRAGAEVMCAYGMMLSGKLRDAQQ